MGALTVTYKEDKSIIEKCGHGYQMITGSVAFTGTYSAGGEALDLRKLLPVDVHMVMIAPNGGYSFEYDYTNRKVKAFTPTVQHTHVFTGSALAAHNHVFTGEELAAHVHDLLVKGEITSDEDLGLLASGPTLGKSAAGDRTVVGVDSATKGGVVGLTAGTPAGANAEITAGTPAGANANAAAAAAAEVASATDLTALTDVRFVAIGK